MHANSLSMACIMAMNTLSWRCWGSMHLSCVKPRPHLDAGRRALSNSLVLTSVMMDNVNHDMHACTGLLKPSFLHTMSLCDFVFLTGMAMLDGIHDMHSLGLIHRDVKPANFCVSPPGYSCGAGDDFEGLAHFQACTDC